MVIPPFLYAILKKIKHCVYNRERFLKYLPKNSIGAEIGVYRGDWTRSILKIVRPKELHLIDGWWIIYGKYYPWKDKRFGASPVKTEDAYERTRMIVKKYDKEKACIFHVGDDLILLKSFSDGYFDWVYLDTAHEYEETVNELELLKDKVKDGGIISGDDWRPDPKHAHHGVCKAVNEFCEKYGWKVAKLDNCAQWYIEKIKAQP